MNLTGQPDEVLVHNKLQNVSTVGHYCHSSYVTIPRCYIHEYFQK